MHSTLPTRLLVDDTHAYILMECEGGNLGVRGNVLLVAVGLVSPNQSNLALTLKSLEGGPCGVRLSLIKKKQLF